MTEDAVRASVHHYPEKRNFVDNSLIKVNVNPGITI